MTEGRTERKTKTGTQRLILDLLEHGLSVGEATRPREENDPRCCTIYTMTNTDRRSSAARARKLLNETRFGTWFGARLDLPRMTSTPLCSEPVNYLLVNWVIIVSFSLIQDLLPRKYYKRFSVISVFIKAGKFISSRNRTWVKNMWSRKA